MSVGERQLLEHCRDLNLQSGQLVDDGSPQDVQVNFEIAVRDLVADDRILCFLVATKARLGYPFGLATDATYGFQYVFEVVDQTQRVFADHTGAASARTCALNFSGKALGVRISTGTPSMACNLP